jgi:hypothetical protein
VTTPATIQVQVSAPEELRRDVVEQARERMAALAGVWAALAGVTDTPRLDDHRVWRPQQGQEAARLVVEVGRASAEARFEQSGL